MEEKKFMRLAITGSSSFGMQGMEQGARKSSTWHAAVGRITGVLVIQQIFKNYNRNMSCESSEDSQFLFHMLVDG